MEKAEATDHEAVDEGQLAEIWTRLREALRERLRREQFETWFTRTALARVDDECVRLAVQNNFTRDWLRNYYRNVIEEAVETVLGGAVRSGSTSSSTRRAPPRTVSTASSITLR